MSFGASFAAGYQVGSDMRKRRATAKYFEEFKNLTKEDDEEMVAEDGTAIPVEKSDAAPVEAEAVATEAIPVEKKPAIQVDSEAASPAEAAIPGAAPAAEAPAAAIPAAAPEPAQAALPPEAKAEATKLDKTMDSMAKARSLTQADIKKLDRLALKAAQASGDIEVYTALQKTTDSFLQGKVQGYLGKAQIAAQNGDNEAVEKYLTKAYRFVPDGNEVKFEKKDGQLYIRDPWAEDGKEAAMIPLRSEQIGYMQVMISDPAKWGEIVRQEKAARRQEAREDRKVGLQEREVASREKFTDAQITNWADRLGIDKEELKLKGRDMALKEAIAPVQRLATYQQALYYGALAESAKNGKANGMTLDQTIDNARMMAGEVDKQFSDYTTPPKDSYTGLPDPNWQPPADVAGLPPNAVQTASGLAQAIGAANMTSADVSPGVAVSAGLALARAGTMDENGRPLGKVEIDAKNGTMTFMYNGAPTEVKLPGNVLQALIAKQAEVRRGAAAGLPAPVQFQDPFAPPEPLFGQQ